MQKYMKLNNGGLIPPIGLGTWGLNSDGQAQESVANALQLGYRLIDTAKIYGNERAVGEGIKASGIPREKIFVTTKLWNSDQGYHTARAAFEESLGKLGLDYLDLYLIHWPATDQRHKAWQALEEINHDGLAKAIGVSNYTVGHLEEMMDLSDTVPAVNQIEFHPFVYQEQRPIIEFCHKHKIVVEAYSPLAQAQDIDNPVISEVAEKHKKTNAQVMIRWAIQHGTVPIPKSTHQERIKENIGVFDFELSASDMKQLNGLSSGKSVFG